MIDCAGIQLMKKEYDLFRILFEESADAVLIIEHETFIDCNRAAVSMLQYKNKEELLNTHPSQLSPEEQPDGRKSFEKAQEMMRLAIEKGSHRFEWDHKRANGEVFPVEVLLTPIPMNGKTILHTVWRDITQRKKSEQALVESESKFKAIFDQSFQFIGICSLDGTLLDANRSSLEASGIDLSSVLGKPFWETPWWNHSSFLQNELKEAFKKAVAGEFVRFEATHPGADGELIYVDFSLKPVKDDYGQVLMLIPEGRDITEIKKTEAQLMQSQKMESLGTLAGGIAHDFNNLLGGIMGTLSLIRHKGDQIQNSKGFLDKCLALMESSCDRASKLVKELLSLSRKEQLTLVPLDLNESVEQVMGILSNSLDKSIELVPVYSDVPLIVMADPLRVEQVVLNLCINAAHAMTIMKDSNQPWGGKLTIQLNPIEVDQEFRSSHPEISADFLACLSVSDQGVGIPLNRLSRIFDPFFTTKAQGKGSGLGLSMIYNIMKQHHGFIDVASNLEQGTSFWVYFPHERHLTPSKNRTAEADNVSKGSGTILVIEDEKILREVVQNILLECGYSVLLAENGKVGVDLYRRQQSRIDAVYLDMAMPVMSGKVAYSQLKLINPEVKVLLASGYDQDKRIQETLKMGIKYFLRKPFSLTSLSKAIAEMMGD